MLRLCTSWWVDARGLPRGQNATRGTACLPCPELMEARGVEPRSEPRSETESTCVGRDRGLHSAVRDRPSSRQALVRSHRLPESTTSSQPDFAIPTRRLRRAATWAGALSAKLRQPGPIQYWQLCVSQWFNQVTGNLGTPRDPSLDPSKPVAPFPVVSRQLSAIRDRPSAVTVERYQRPAGPGITPPRFAPCPLPLTPYPLSLYPPSRIPYPVQQSSPIHTRRGRCSPKTVVDVHHDHAGGARVEHGQQCCDPAE